MDLELHRDVIDVGIRLTVATLCGGAIGWNRERKHRPAGLRTLMLVSLGAAAFALLGDRVYANMGDQTGAGRVMAGIVGGIGFLGAGTIMQDREAIRGVTTAAAIWVTAGLGTACGMGYYPVAGFGVILAMMVLWLGPVEKQFFGDKHPQGNPPARPHEGAYDEAERESGHQPP